MTTGSNCTACINQSLNLTDADMSITLTNTDPPYAGSFGFATLTSVVTNKGAATATNVTVTIRCQPPCRSSRRLPRKAPAPSAATAFTCTLGTMVSGATSTIAIQLHAVERHFRHRHDHGERHQPDPNMANNTASLTINPPNLFPTSISSIRRRWRLGVRRCR